MRHVPGSILFVLTAMVSVALMGSVSRAQNVQIPNPLTTGEQYLNLSESHRMAYIMGLIDGIFVGPGFGASQAKVIALQQCVIGRTSAQMSAVLSKYIQARPERWHQGANILFYSLMFERCPGVKPQ